MRCFISIELEASTKNSINNFLQQNDLKNILVV
jgi:hypothetical protein